MAYDPILVQVYPRVECLGGSVVGMTACDEADGESCVETGRKGDSPSGVLALLRCYGVPSTCFTAGTDHAKHELISELHLLGESLAAK